MLLETWDFGWGRWPQRLPVACPGAYVASLHGGCAPAASVPEDNVEVHGIFVTYLWTLWHHRNRIDGGSHRGLPRFKRRGPKPHDSMEGVSPSH